MKKIIILGAGEMQLPVIQKAKDNSIYTIVVDKNPKAPGMLIANETASISTNDFDSVLTLAIKNNIDGILTTSDLPVNIVARVAKELSLPAMSIDVAKACTDKYLQRSLLKRSNIKTPTFKLIKHVAELKEVTFLPLVMKPVDSSASRGVKKVMSFDELECQYIKSKEYSKKGHVIVEEFIDGREFSVETITQKGITTIVAITEKRINNSNNGYFVEDRHIIPARISKDEHHIISVEVLKAINVLEIDNSPTHTEVMLNKNGAYIIEIACRLGGDFITSHLVKLATGVDMLEQLINLSLGKEINIEPKREKVAAVQFLNTDNYERCVNFISAKCDSLVHVEIKPEHSRDIKNSNDRMGCIILQTNSIDKMENLLMQIS